MPLEFEGVYDAAAYAKSQDYTRAKSIFGLWYRSFDLALFFAFWLVFDGFELVDQLVQAWAAGPIRQGLLYFGVIMLGSSVLSLPWSVYSTFVLEERYGFNRTTLTTFVTDRLKGLALVLLIGPPLAAGVLWFFLEAGRLAWLYCWLLLAAVQLLLMCIAPVCLMPLFLKFTPLADGELKTAIEDYARRVDFEFGGIYEIDGSTRSSHSNAFFTGFGATKRIALFDTLIRSATVDELVAVLAHEVGHEKHGHVIQSLAVSLAYSLAMLYLMAFLLSYPPLFTAFGVRSDQSADLLHGSGGAYGHSLHCVGRVLIPARMAMPSIVRIAC